MARINIDDNIESQPEFQKLVKLTQDHDRALGMLVRFWRLAQHYWGRELLVPFAEMDRHGLDFIIQSGWGLTKPTGVYAIHSEVMFEWYRQVYEASKKGIAARKAKKPKDKLNNRPVTARLPAGQPSFSKRRNIALSSRTPASMSSTKSLDTLSPRTSADVFSTSKTKNTLRVGGSDEPAPGDLISDKNQEMKKFIAAYVKSYGDRYEKGGTRPRPDLSGKVLGQIKSYLKDVSLDRACQAIAVYCQMQTKWFETKSHDFSTFLMNLNGIYRALDTGRDPEYDLKHTDTSKLNLEYPEGYSEE